MPSEGTRAAGAQGWITSLIEQGFGNQRITEILVEQGLSYRRQNMLRDINQQRLEILNVEKIRELGPAEKVPETLYRTIEGRPVEPYRAIVEGEWTNPNTQEVTKRSITLHFHSVFSQNDVLAELEKLTDLYLEAEGYQFTKHSKIEYFKVNPISDYE